MTEFTQEELTTIVRWAEYEERTAPFQGCDQAVRARAIKAKVSARLAETPSQRLATQAEKTVQPS